MVYAEVLKNLKTLKLDRASATPVVQLIDLPLLLTKTKLGITKGVLFGGFLGGIYLVLYLLSAVYLT